MGSARRISPFIVILFVVTCSARLSAQDFRGTSNDAARRSVGGRQAIRVADERRRIAPFSAKWLGHDGADRTGPGPSVGPDGNEDVHIQLLRLDAKRSVKAIRVEQPGGNPWEFGINPRLFANAEFVRDAKDPSRGDLYIQPDRNLRGQVLKLIAAYDDESFGAATVVAGACAPAQRLQSPPLPVFSEDNLRARWLGQDGANPGSGGDVHIAVEGTSALPQIIGAVLTDAVRGTWIFRERDGVPIPAESSALPLTLRRASDQKSIDLFLRPYRDDSRETMTLWLITADGNNLLTRFPGGSADLSKLAPRPAPTTVIAQPGDDLQKLVDQFGTVSLAPGVFPMQRPLVLNNPVVVTSDGHATILFDQAASEPPWSAAIKVHCGNSMLSGFKVRFAGPVRWNTSISYGPAVIGMTDNLDAAHDENKENITFTHLDLEGPPVADASRWVEAPRLMRLIRSRSGLIADNVLRGGPIEFLQGPWRILNNDFRGTIPGTFSHGVFIGHATYDLVLQGNRARDIGPSGKTWRLLVLSWQGYNDVVNQNSAIGLGSLEGDTIPWSNEPEIILTEAYHIRYEGAVIDLGLGGRLLRVGQPQSIAGRTGDVVAILDGSAAGEWRRISQAIDGSTYLLDRPIPADATTVSIAQGFVDETFRDNKIDIRGGRKSFGLVFVGNHFGTQIIGNHLLGGESACKLTACPSESPVMWGWTHAPYLGGVFEANIIEDVERGGTLGVEHNPRYIKSNRGRTYMTMRMDKNVLRWSEPFLKRMARAKSAPGPLTLGYPDSGDPGEFVVRAGQNVLEAPNDELYTPSMVVQAARYNGQELIARDFRLPPATASESPRGRAADKGSPVRPR